MSDKAMKHEPTNWDRLSPYDRYQNDPAFHVLVDTLRYHLEHCQYTPSELREACHLAACIYEERRVRPMLLDPKEPFKWNLK
jgi:hypothetical protein